MKTAEEWFNENSDSADATGHWYWNISEEQIKAIQLDAFKAGMTEAANIKPINICEYSPTIETYDMAVEDMRSEILSTRDTKTEI